jgi:aminoglycoside phosphotransferase
MKEITIGKSGAIVLDAGDYIIKKDNNINFIRKEAEKLKYFSFLKIPQIISYEENDCGIITMSKIKGQMLKEDAYLNDCNLLYKVFCEVFNYLYSFNLIDCIYVNTFEMELENIRKNYNNAKINKDDLKKVGFSSKKEALNYLERNKPEEEFVLSHGDLCLPNVFAIGDQFSGFVDCGRMGIADKYVDIVDCCESLYHNFYGIFSSGRFSGYDEDDFFNAINVKKDKEKIHYIKTLYLF